MVASNSKLKTPKALLSLGALTMSVLASSAGAMAAPVIDNERVTIWDVTCTKDDPNPVPKTTDDIEAVCVKDSDDGKIRKGSVQFSKNGTVKLKPGERAIVINFKDHPTEPLANNSGLPNAFPRPGAKKILENKRVIVWKYNWTLGVTSAQHFHDKDMIPVFLQECKLSSIAPDGKEAIMEYKDCDVRFNARGKMHQELLKDGSATAILTELKDGPVKN